MNVASLTTTPQRKSNFIYQCIDSIANQTIKFDIIHIYFQGTKQQCWFNDIISDYNNLKISYITDKYGSKSKYYYALNEYNDYNITLFDDDMTYNPHLLEYNLIGHNLYNDCLISGIYTFPYLDIRVKNCFLFLLGSKFERTKEYKNKYIRTLSGWGTFIPAHILDNTDVISDIDNGHNIFPTSDECWLYCNCIKYNIPTYCHGFFGRRNDLFVDNYVYYNCLYSRNTIKEFDTGYSIYSYLYRNNIDLDKITYEDLDNEI